MCKSIDIKRKFHRILSRKAEKLNLTEFKLIEFDPIEYPCVTGNRIEYDSLCERTKDEMMIQFELEGFKFKANFECKYLTVMIKVSIELQQFHGKIQMKMSPNLVHMKFAESPKMTLKIEPFLDDVHLNLYLVKSTIQSAIVNSLDAGFVRKWHTQLFFMKSKPPIVPPYSPSQQSQKLQIPVPKIAVESSDQQTAGSDVSAPLGKRRSTSYLDLIKSKLTSTPSQIVMKSTTIEESDHVGAVVDKPVLKKSSASYLDMMRSKLTSAPASIEPAHVHHHDHFNDNKTASDQHGKHPNLSVSPKPRRLSKRQKHIP